MRQSSGYSALGHRAVVQMTYLDGRFRLVSGYRVLKVVCRKAVRRKADCRGLWRHQALGGLKVGSLILHKSANMKVHKSGGGAKWET